jgi:hypothetical protein
MILAFILASPKKMRGLERSAAVEQAGRLNAEY